MTPRLALLIAYSAALVVIGLLVARRVRGSADFFVAGRRLPPLLLFATVLASNIGAGSTVGAAALAYRDGLGAWWWNGAAAAGSVVLALVVGPRVWRLASQHGLYTAGDLLELRYGRLVRALVTSLIWLGTLSILAGQLIAGAAVLGVVADVPRFEGTIIGAAVMTAYFMAGGLLSSAWVNLVQLVVLLAGFAVAVPMVIAGAGGLSAILAPAGAPATFGDIMHSSGAGSGWTLLLLFGPAFIVSPGLMQKAYGAVDESAVRWGIGAQAVALALFSFAPVLLGMAGRTVYPDLQATDTVLPLVLAERLPAWTGALALAAVFSAEVSTCDALLFMLSTSLSQDLYKRFVSPAATDRQVLMAARAAALAGGAGGVLLALQLPTVQTALGIFYSLLGVSLLVPVVGGLFLARAGQREALASIGAGTAGLLVVRFAFPAKPAWLDPTMAGLVCAAAAFAIMLTTRRHDIG
ncbi:MAG: sodium:solute symporter family protein [Vicinamibacterales bacterium]